MDAIIRLECPSEIVYNWPQSFTAYDGLSPPEYFIMFHGSDQEPLLNFFSVMGFTAPTFKTPIDNTTIYGFMLFSYNVNHIPYLFRGKQRTVESDIAAGLCSFVFDSLNAPIYTLIGPNDANAFTGNFSNIKQKTPSCSYYTSLQAARDIASSINNMSTASDYTALQKLQFQNALLQSSDAIMGCLNLLNQYVTPSIEQYLIANTTDCLRDATDPAFGSDPCCNTTLQYIQCCAPGPKSLQLQVLDNVRVAELKCATPIQSTALLADYILSTNNAQDPVDGCRAVTGRNFNQQKAAQYTDFINSCLNSYYGTPAYAIPFVPCETDADCLTSCDTLSSFCHVEWQNPDPVMLDCHMARMDPLVMKLLKDEWNLPQNISLPDFENVYFNELSTENCVGFVGFAELQWGPDQVWTSNPLYKTVCAPATSFCNYNFLSTDCDTDSYQCVYSLLDLNFTIFYPEYCVLENMANNDTCDEAGGIWDTSLQPWPCMLPNTTYEECLPTNLCPGNNSGDWFVHTQCSGAFCYRPNVTQSDCTTQCDAQILQKWNPNSLDGGFCQVLAAHQDECEKANATWWSGRSWSDGRFGTEEECLQGSCLFGTGQYLGISPQSCVQQQGCNRACQTCTSTNSINLCYATGMTSCDCAVAGGSYNGNYSICEFSLGRSSCNAQNHTFLSCADLSRSQCDACAAGTSCPQYYEIMKCEFAVNGVCQDQDSCLSSSGSCNDPFRTANKSCLTTGAFITPDCGGACVYPLSPTQGQWTCTLPDITYATGCISNAIQTKAECESTPGYTWHEKAFSEADCLVPQACKTDGSFDLRTGSQCTECGGEETSMFQWAKGSWIHGKVQELRWIKGEIVPTSVWKPTIDFNKVAAIVNKVIAQQYSYTFQSEVSRRFIAIGYQPQSY
eukprot:Phypoly_transcript_00411.p1 GENE.Phypoly_transcript_00411~~Phypoly_transcript_00411.p1  ORF type:complete len:998 (+),score=75.57 Phypoly_transcript_00411:291-2996(+)